MVQQGHDVDLLTTGGWARPLRPDGDEHPGWVADPGPEPGGHGPVGEAPTSAPQAKKVLGLKPGSPKKEEWYIVLDAKKKKAKIQLNHRACTQQGGRQQAFTPSTGVGTPIS